jgi:type IV pilus assembly protein PilY1
MKRTGKFFGTGPLAAVLAVLSLALPVAADDTEIYFHSAPPTAPPPLVMLTLDWRSNLTSTFPGCAHKGDASCIAAFGTDSIGTQIYGNLDVAASDPVAMFDAFRAVFKTIFNSNVADGMRVGFMMNHNNDNGCTTGSIGCSNGGYVLRGFELFQAGDGNGAKQELLDIMKDIPLPQGPLAHPYQGLELFFELYRYMAGLDVMNGELGYTDFNSVSGGGPVGTRGTPTRNLDYEFSVGFGSPAVKCAFTVGANSGDNRRCLDYIHTAGYTLSASSNLSPGPVRIPSTLTWDPNIIHKVNGKDRYISPYSNGEDWSCSGAYSINLLFQVSQQDADSNTAITQTLANQGLQEWGLKTNPQLTFTNIIAALHNNDIAGGQASGVPSPSGSQTLTSYFLVDNNHANTTTNGYASAGGTTNAIAALDDPRALFKALSNIFKQIASISSTYVAVTVPVNADNRVTSLPNMFVALFQVDKNGKPYWPGNVKKLDVVTTTLTDGSKQLDIKDALGATAFNPITGRLNDSALTVWTDPSAADVVAADTTLGEVSGRDGSSVRRGGAGHKIPGYRSGSVGESNSTTGARQIFIDPATVTGSAAAGNPMVALDASSSSTLLTDTAIQDLLGIHATSPTATCPGRDASNYCVTFIGQVLTQAGQTPTGVTATDASTATRLFLRWIRGYDVFNESGPTSGWNGLTTTAQRKWLMGDVLHSRPVAVNYGGRSGYGTDNQDVRLIFGSNDGLLHMVRNTAPGTSKPADVPTQQGNAYGQEVWAFLPRELLAHVPDLAMNFSDEGLNRPYGADGPPTLFTIDTNGDGIITNNGSCTVGADDCDRAWIYFGLRRGGKSYYAVDVSWPDATTPKLLWKINSTMTDFTELGMTFSPPRVGWVRFEDVTGLNQFGSPATNVPVPVVIFGGGYNGHKVSGGDHHQSGTGGPSKDTILGTPFIGADTQGNAIYIVHARTGQLIWKATYGTSTGAVDATHYTNTMMQHGIAAPVSPMDSDGDGILDRLYVADTGGRVWRVDLPEFVPGGTPAVTRTNSWKATVLADLRPSDTDLATSTVNDLRFFHGATIVRRARDSIGVYDALYLGSGDREHPQSDTYDVTSGMSTTTVTKINWFFLLKDRLTTTGDPAVASRTAYAPGDLLDVTDKCFSGSGTTCVSDTTSTSNNLQNGWRLKLEGLGEKNLSEPFIGGEGVIFTTYLPRGTSPDDKPCLPLGASRLYQVSLDDGAPLRFLHDVVGTTFSKTDRWINLYSGIDGGVVAVSPDFWITSTGKSGGNPPQKPIRFYWRENGVDAVK